MIMAAQTGTGTAGSAWLIFVALTIICWGMYGILLHGGQVAMGDPSNGRYKAFLWVGIAYVVVAVLAPIIMMIANGSDWSMTGKGTTLSFIAGVVGAVGAFAVLLAFGAKGHPAVVMSLIFAGAPIVNAVVALSMHPPAGGIGSLRWQFVAGILLAAVGGMLVTLYKPPPGHAKPTAAANATTNE